VPIDEGTVDWITTAPKEGHREEPEFHTSQVGALERGAACVQERLDVMHEDKLDRKTTEDLWERTSIEWRRRQLEVRAPIGRHERVNHRYFDEGVRVLQLAQKACDLWTQQPAERKREFLGVLPSNCTLDGQDLDVSYGRPFCSRCGVAHSPTSELGPCVSLRGPEPLQSPPGTSSPPPNLKE
jgi:hypothetical protein